MIDTRIEECESGYCLIFVLNGTDCYKVYGEDEMQLRRFASLGKILFRDGYYQCRVDDRTDVSILPMSKETHKCEFDERER